MVTAMTTGFIMAIIRSNEPYFKLLIRKQFLGWFGELLSEKEIKESSIYMNDTLVTFLTSSLNVELVHVILVSISKNSGKIKDGANQKSYTM